MSEKKKSSVSKVSRVFTQARESLKLLETLEKETLAKARNFVRNPIKLNRKKAKSEKNDKFGFRSLGVVTRSEWEQLERKVESLKNELQELQALLAKSGTIKRPAKAAARPVPSAEAFPNT